MLHAAWGIRRPSSIANLFGWWLNGIPKQFKNLIRVGAAALCWSVWFCRNAAVFENKNSSFFAGTLQDYALAEHLGYPSTVYFAGGACCGLSVLGAGDQGYFLPGAWVAI